MQRAIRQAIRAVPQPDIVIALTTLSRLAVRTSTLRVASPSVAQHWARLLLKQLLVVCAAQQGALFVAPSEPHVSPTHPLRVDLAQSEWSLCARLSCCEEEAYAALKPFASKSDSLQCSADGPATVCWKRVMPGPKYPCSQPIWPSIVAIVLRWSHLEPDAQEVARQQAILLLPLLADLVDTILVHIFTTHMEVERPAEILPTELLATIGHEFLSPLTTIQGYAQTLSRYESQLTPAERQEFLHAICQASAHISLLVNRFLELAQFETHTRAFFPAPINMQALTQEALTAVQENQSHRLLLLPTMLPEPQEAVSLAEMPSQDALTIEGDWRLLRSMLDILLENALVYSAPGSLVEVFLEPRTFTAETAGSFLATARHPLALILPATFHDQEPLLEIRVQDRGRGIAPEELSAIFRRFYRGDNSLTREVNGLGLGLALCKAIVAQHQGMLWVESALGEGSTFHVLLPRRQAFASQGDEERIERNC